MIFVIIITICFIKIIINILIKQIAEKRKINWDLEHYVQIDIYINTNTVDDDLLLIF